MAQTTRRYVSNLPEEQRTRYPHNKPYIDMLVEDTQQAKDALDAGCALRNMVPANPQP